MPGEDGLAPEVSARHDSDLVPLALVFAHEHDAGLEARTAPRLRSRVCRPAFEFGAARYPLLPRSRIRRLSGLAKSIESSIGLLKQPSEVH